MSFFFSLFSSSVAPIANRHPTPHPVHLSRLLPRAFFSGKITPPLAKFKKKQYLCTRKGFMKEKSQNRMFKITPPMLQIVT